jgi:exopolyphosphatase/guanosine-5'-triphosphate,3'-diphosphate pyrophosphatase
MVEGTRPAPPGSAPGSAIERRDAPLAAERTADGDAPGAPTAATAADAAAPADLRRRARIGGRGFRRQDGGRPARGPFYAALDLGTNNCRLLVAEPAGETFRVVDSFSRIVRLGEGVAKEGSLNAAAMERAIGALRICSHKLSDRPIAAARLIATEACRRAENGAAFLTRVRDELGLDLEIVDRRTEARLAVEGCLPLLDETADGAVVFDIGGGSSEIVWVDRRRSRRHGLIRAWVSLPLGVVTLAERHGGAEVDDAVFEAMVADVRHEFHLFRAREGLKQAVRERVFHFLGTSGTVTTLAGVYLELPRYDRRRVDGLWMEAAEIEAMMGRLRAMDYAARRANPCIGAERADLVLAGCAIFEAIRREWPCRRLRVADRGLREGMLVQLMRTDGFLRRPPGGGRP